MNTNSTQTFAKMILRFIRKSGDSSSNDDIITIQPKWRSLDTNNEISLLEYVVSVDFSPVGMESKKIHKQTMRLVGKQVLTYLESLLNLTFLDSEPYKFIQVDVPCVPSVLLDLDTVSDATQSILQIVQVCISNWPTTSTPQQSNVPQSYQPVARHLIFEDENDRGMCYNNY